MKDVLLFIVLLMALVFGGVYAADYCETRSNGPPTGTYAGKVLHVQQVYDRTLVVTDKGKYFILGEVPLCGSRVFVSGDKLWVKSYYKWAPVNIVNFETYYCLSIPTSNNPPRKPVILAIMGVGGTPLHCVSHPA